MTTKSPRPRQRPARQTSPLLTAIERAMARGERLTASPRSACRHQSYGGTA